MIDFKVKEKEILDFWDKQKIFQKSITKDAPHGDYLFYDGPPFATGTPHYGHLVASIMKDVVPRYFTMQGYRVERKWGWDVHGLPIENIVERDLGFATKKDIEKYGIDKFNEECRSRVMEYADAWKGTIRRLGRWVDMDNDYKTMDPEFMETIWWVFQELWNKGLIYEDYRSMHICPRCETTLSQSEVTEGYKDIKDLSVIAKFELVDEPGTYLLAWTTTPWTLPGNMALAIGKDISYLKFKVIKSNSPLLKEGDRYILSSNYFLNLAFAQGSNSKGPAIMGPTVLRRGFEGTEINEIEEINASSLVGKRYKPLFEFLDKNLADADSPYFSSLKTLEGRQAIKNAVDESYYRVREELKGKIYKIYLADFINIEEGTGVVHIAPAYGEDDLTLAKVENFPAMLQHVAMDGTISGDVSYHSTDDIEQKLAGLNVKPKGDHQATDVEIIKYLAKKNLLFSKEKYEHSYPHCWRCDTPLLNYATSSWFVSVLKIKSKLLKNAEKINWVPEHIKAGRFGKWLEGARDWSISRQRFWGSVIPLWVCDHCDKKVVVGSVKELKDLSGVEVKDLHKHIVDKVTFKCDCGAGTMKRIPDVLDCWFESGSMPYAQSHYPFEGAKEFDQKFPAKFIAEGADQTRAWFYYLHVIAGGLKNSRAYENCIVNGIVLAEDGKKMSKRLSNYPEPDLVMEKYGADALRMYLLSSPVMLAENFSFTEKDLQTVYRRYIVILQNVLNFYLMFSGSKKLTGDKPKKLDNKLDKWVVSKLVNLQHEVSSEMASYNLVKPTRAIFDFVDGLSTWYVRRSRDRFKDGDKQAIDTLAFVLKELAKIIAPFSPMTAETIYAEFDNQHESVHLEKWTKLDKKLVNQEVLQQMDSVKEIAERAHALRAKSGMKVRQPLAKVEVLAKDLKLADSYTEILKDELNVENVELVKELNISAGWIIDENKTISLDTNLTDELKDKGIVRELIRSINALRKEAGLKSSDRPIETYSTKSSYLKAIIVKYKDELMTSTSAGDFIEAPGKTKFSQTVKINDEEIILGLKI